MAELKQLFSKRKFIKSQLTRFKTYVNTFTESFHITEADILQLEFRLSKAEPLIDEFNTVQLNIQLLITAEAEDDSDDCELFETTYFEIITTAKHLISNSLSHTQIQSSSNQSNDSNVKSNVKYNVKLPIIKLQLFDGSYDQWMLFYDTFNSLIHSSNSISNIEKFHYLRSSLKGDALNVIHSLETSSENYEIAWQLLKDRYENKRLITIFHVKSLFNLSTIFKESYLELRNLLDLVNKHLRALKVLNQPTEYWDTLLIHIISDKLDSKTRREWESLKLNGEMPTMLELFEFLKTKCQQLEIIDSTRPVFKPQPNQRSKHIKSYVALDVKKLCSFCKGSHAIFNCQEFFKLSIKTRIEEAKKLSICLNCLNKGHYSNNCKSIISCKKCGKRHHTLLHLINQAQSDASEQHLVTVSNHTIEQNETQVLLSTAYVQVSDIQGEIHECRVLLDSGSQSSFITDQLCNHLQLKKVKFKIAVKGISESQMNIKYATKIHLQSRHNNFKTILNCLVVPTITGNIPSISFERSKIKLPQNITLADPTFNEAGKIDMLLGANIFWQLLCIGQIRLGKNQPIIQKTHLGWVVSGAFNSNLENQKTTTVCHCESHENIDELISKFWDLEECKPTRFYSAEEQTCETHFMQTHTRDTNGRFIVRIPLKETASNLGDSKQIAIKRFHLLEKRLAKDNNLKLAYSGFIKEYEDLKHMSNITNHVKNDDFKTAYYLPHHAVWNPNSTTTRLRVVFDGSAKTTNGNSFNDIQMIGPTIQDDLISIIMRFRKHKYVMTADITKMYRQVLVHEEDRSMQRILWRPDISQPINCYELNTITYGTASAPFLAIRCLQQLAHENAEQYPVASSVILHDFYVDDLLTGTETVEEAVTLRNEVTGILESGGFMLRKWVSNNPRILKDKVLDSSNDVLILGDHEVIKTLGVTWQASSDTIKYNIKNCDDTKSVTKRNILSSIAQIFDPLGLLGPTTIIAKIILQRLWQYRLSWDESIPNDLYTQWIQFKNQLHILNKISIPRHVICNNPIKIQLHGFCDASEMAYGACIYIKSLDILGNSQIKLLCAKTRVAPLKTTTIPRLELCGALLLSRLVQKVVNSLNISFDEHFYWCDSTIVLAWINTSASQLKTFVANRIAEIQSLTNLKNWNHVISGDNPADLLSRGVNPNNLIKSNIWWNGPIWLSMNTNEWPINNGIHKTLEILPNNELRKTKLISNFHLTVEFNLIQRYSTLSKLQRVVAYCLRFKKNASQQKEFRQLGPLILNELNDSLMCLIKFAQQQAMFHDIQSLLTNKRVNSKSKLLNLNPFIDSQGIIRVGGRLQKSNFSYEKKHPIILPSKHTLSDLIVKHEHIRLLHAGPQALLSSIRENYWPLSGRNLIRKIVHNCVHCFKIKPRHMDYLMGNLPQSRVMPARPFLSCGVDYAGPFLIKDRKGRGCKTIKSYVCLFICFSTKAIHLELVTDLTTETFLNALRRFFSRRGKCLHIYSDNATNFLGAKNELLQLHNFLKENNNFIQVQSSNEGVNWHFIPPNSPHFGGLWEAGVKSIKYHLKRVISNALLTFEQFYTVLLQIEACVNSRPLHPLSNDPNDLLPLTPAHFIIGEKLTTIPDQNMLEIPENRLSQYQRLQNLLQHFWTRWSKEYIAELQVRTKWRKQGLQNLKPGTLVIIKEDNVPPMQWHLGRVMELHSGKDNICRTVTVKTTCGEYKRPVTKLCALPIE